jgi:aspartate aminotransferase
MIGAAAAWSPEPPPPPAPGFRLSPNLALNQAVAERRERGESIIQLGFGEARLPVLDGLVDRLVLGAQSAGYGPVAGSAASRDAVAGYFCRRGLDTDGEQIVMGPGSKPLLMALDLALDGDIVIPRPSWNSYAPQIEFAGRTPIPVDIPPECGGIPDPELLPAALAAARRRGHDPCALILNLPDNPTGTLASERLIRAIARIAESEDLILISDEIYRDLMHDPDAAFFSPADVSPSRTVITTGMSKSLAIGGWRLGAARFPASGVGELLRRRVTAVASDIWSTIGTPVQEVAAYAFSEPPEVRSHIRSSAKLHGTVAAEVHRIVTRHGARCRPPTGAFYLYPDFGDGRAHLARHGVTDSVLLQSWLLYRFGVAVLPGSALGDDPRALRVKLATSMLYGDTAEQQQAALDSDAPLELPHVRTALRRIEEAFAALSSEPLGPVKGPRHPPTLSLLISDPSNEEASWKRWTWPRS